MCNRDASLRTPPPPHSGLKSGFLKELQVREREESPEGDPVQTHETETLSSTGIQ